MWLRRYLHEARAHEITHDARSTLRVYSLCDRRCLQATNQLKRAACNRQQYTLPHTRSVQQAAYTQRAAGRRRAACSRPQTDAAQRKRSNIQ